MSDQLLKKYGFKTPKAGLAQRAEQARKLADEIGYPVVLKIASPDIVHKIDAGGVRLNLYTGDQVSRAYGSILQKVKGNESAAQIQGVRVEEMCQGGLELVIGLINDDQFGPSIMFGLGGTFVEVLQDVSFRVLPITEQDAEQMIGEIKGREVLEGYRGLPSVSRTMLTDLLLKAGEMGVELAPRLDSVDLNPIMVWPDDHRVLDAKILLREEAQVIDQKPPNTKDLSKFFQARSVALVGASSTPGKIGNAVLDSLANHEYKGKVFPINPKRDEIMSRKAYPDLSSIPEPVELVVVTIALAQVPDVLRECARVGVNNVVVVSGGGKELGGESERLEEEIGKLVVDLGVRVIGPNCIGIFDGETRLDTFFQVQERMVRPPHGPVAMFTQSGTVGAAFLEKADRVGVSKFVSYGNRVDVDESDLIAYSFDDPDTKVIACYVEGLANGRKFLDAARKVTKTKPIVVFKGGQSDRGARASISHTGFFGGSHALFAGAMRQAGVILMDSIEELYAASEALAMQPAAPGNRFAMISNGAGTMVQAIDLMGAYGLQLADPTEETLATLEGLYPPFYLVQNPLDVTGSATSADYKNGIEGLLKDPHVDIVMPWFVFQDTPLEEDIVGVLGALSDAYDKPILCGAMGGPYTEKMSNAIRAVGVPVYGTVREWVAAASAVAGCGTT
jgi:3-hydroxypropionyl-CoA synthetase (ADP-forming)